MVVTISEGCVKRTRADAPFRLSIGNNRCVRASTLDAPYIFSIHLSRNSFRQYTQPLFQLLFNEQSMIARHPTQQWPLRTILDQSVYRHGGDALAPVVVLDAMATLTSPVLPGFAAPVASLFPAK